MISIHCIFWIVPVVFVIGYLARVLMGIVCDPRHEADESHAATRYAESQPGESPIAREARKAAEVIEPTKEQIAAARKAARSTANICEGTYFDCCNCPVEERCDAGVDASAAARAWLAAHNLPEVEP